jgi:hypothetical protein
VRLLSLRVLSALASLVLMVCLPLEIANGKAGVKNPALFLKIPGNFQCLSTDLHWPVEPWWVRSVNWKN